MFSFLKSNKKEVKDYLKDLRGTQSIPSTLQEKEARRTSFPPFSQREEDLGSLVPRGPLDGPYSQSSIGHSKADIQSQILSPQPPLRQPSPSSLPQNSTAPQSTMLNSPLQSSRAIQLGSSDQSFQSPNYQQMMYNPMMNQLKNSRIFAPMQSDFGGMPMMMPFGYNPYFQPVPQVQPPAPSIQHNFQTQMLAVSEAK